MSSEGRSLIPECTELNVFPALLSLSPPSDEWVKFDDDKVSLVSPEDILRLSGGGDWHIAYVLLYGPRRLEMEADQ